MTYTKMKTPMRYFSILVLAFILSFGYASAQGSHKGKDRERVFSEMRVYKHDALAKELSLSKEQQAEFFAVYDDMENRLRKIGEETRRLEKAISSNQEASDAEIEKAAAEIYAQKQKEGAVEMEYFEKFKQILTPRQLLMLKSAEKKFNKELMRQHQRMHKKN